MECTFRKTQGLHFLNKDREARLEMLRARSKTLKGNTEEIATTEVAEVAKPQGHINFFEDLEAVRLSLV